MRLFTFILILLLCSTYSFGQVQLFSLNNESIIIATKDKENTIGLNLNRKVYRDIISKKHQNILIKLPFFHNSVNLTLEKFQPYNHEINIVSKSRSGDKTLDILPTLLSYKLYLNNEVIGIMNFVNNNINATFKINNKQYEIGLYKKEYVLFETSNSINKSNFSCAVSEVENTHTFSPQMNQLPSTPVCVKLAVEIDYFTRQTFTSDQQATDWALAIIAGVSQIYETETNSAIQVVYINIWNTNDPFSSWVAQSSSMLSELKTYWTTNNGSISRDLVHLMTKRTNTGTGGIAYVDALCSNSWGYGFSSYLDNDTTYNFPNPSYTWNLFCIAHEIGHNYGSKHTHWCGWAADPTTTPPFAGGVIDNCVDVEGSCTNNPTPQLGTIMSYCHTTSGGSILDFHEVVVSQALDPGIANANCLTTCDYYGCTDTSAFNYDPNATIDDGSCIPKIYGCIDPPATNYNPLANTDDGSCTYCASLLFNNTDISCFGAGDGIIEVNISNSSGTSFSFDWSGPNGFIASTSTNTYSNVNQEGTFTVVVTDNLGCSDTASAYMNEPSQLVINGVITTSVSCNGLSDGTALVNLTGGTPPYNYNFGGNNSNQLASGSYSVAVSDTNNCPPVSAPFSITEPDIISDNAIQNNISCNNYYDGSINLSMSGGTSPFTYSWSGPNGYSSIFEDIVGLVDGFYQVNILDYNNCLFNNIFNITNPSLLDTSSVIKNNISCNGGNNGSIILDVTGGTPSYNYSWSNGDTSYQTTNVSVGIYNVTITDANGCNFPILYFTLQEPNPSNLTNTISDIDCFGNSNGSIGITYITTDPNIVTIFNWTSPNGFFSSQEDINNLSEGTYVLSVTEDNNCQNSFSFIVSEPDLIEVNELTQGTSCFNGNNGTVNLNISGGVPIYITDWFGNNPQVLAAGIYLYTITDNNGCFFSDSVIISEPSTAINVIDSITHVNCFNGMDGTASFSISGGVFPYTESWPNADPFQLLAGYSVYEILDFNNCLYVDSVFIDQPILISVNEQINDVLCDGMSTGSALIQVMGGTSPYSYLWSNADTNQIASNLAAGSYIYNITDFNGCQNQGVISINQSSPILAQNIITSSTCSDTADGSVSVIITGGLSPYSQNWNGNNPSALIAGTYNYTVIDSAGCIDSNQVFVHSLSDIQSVATIENVSCNTYCDGSINLIITNGINPYVIEYFDNNDSIVASNQLCAGEYKYQITDALGCDYIDSFLIIEPQSLDLVINAQSNLLQAVAAGGTTPYIFQWWNSSGLLSNFQDLNITQSGVYYCIVYDYNNCHSDTMQYIVQEVGIDEIDNQISVYPNPTNDKLFVETSQITDNINCLMTDVLGQRVRMSSGLIETTYIIDCSDYAKGVYLLSVFINDDTYFRKIIIE